MTSNSKSKKHAAPPTSNAVASIAGAPSPSKKFKVPASKVNSPTPTKQKKALKLTCYGWCKPLRFEVYLYEKSINEDGYTWGVQKYLKDEFEQKHESLEHANFTRVLTRRVPFSSNVAMTGASGYRRVVFIRYPKGDEGSTKETRQEGLQAMKSFLMDPKFSDYPPKIIETEDLTNEDNYAPLDQFLMDDDIEELMKLDIPLEVLDGNFKEEYGGFADACWRGPNFSDWAKTLGFVKA
jgi:hypothetical protein